MRRLDYCSSRGPREAPDWLGLRAERVVAETLELAERYGATELAFKDEDFFADAQRVEEIANGLVDAGSAARLASRGSPAGRARNAARGARSAASRQRLPLAAAGVDGSGARGPARGGDAAARGRHRGPLRVRRQRGRGARARASRPRSRSPARSARSTAASRRRSGATATSRRRRLRPGARSRRWAALERQPWADATAERRLARRAFFFAEAQRPPGRRLGKHLLRVLALLRVRLGFFALDIERVAVELSALLRTGTRAADAGRGLDGVRV